MFNTFHNAWFLLLILMTYSIFNFGEGLNDETNVRILRQTVKPLSMFFSIIANKSLVTYTRSRRRWREQIVTYARSSRQWREQIVIDTRGHRK
jgi:hypothetical protein